MRPLGIDRTYADPMISYDGLHSKGGPQGICDGLFCQRHAISAEKINPKYKTTLTGGFYLLDMDGEI
jgi:hypothetical protein